MLPMASDWERKRRDLKNRRAALFGEFEKSPSDVELALKIKVIDDEIAECTKFMNDEKRAG